jgi:hypothetical protein
MERGLPASRSLLASRAFHVLPPRESATKVQEDETEERKVA